MAFVTVPPRTRLIDWLAAPFRALGRFLVLLAEAGPRLAALDRLNRLSDEELAARGTTREAEVQRIMGFRSYI